ncbi:MAG: DMT family transporter [Granulosicoccaceae bacterium]
MQTGNDNLKGVLIMALGMLLIPGMDAIAKYVGPRVSVGQIVWCRFFFQTLFMGSVALLFLNKEQLRFSHPLQHLARATMISLATGLFFTALQYMPLAESIAIFFVEPLILTVLAGVFLKEKIGWRRILAVTIGFGGAMMIVQPEFAKAGWAAALPMGAALAFAIYLLLTKRLSGHTHPVAIQLFTGAGATLVMSVALAAGAALQLRPLAPAWPASNDLYLLIGMGLIASVGHLFVVMAFARTSAATLAPLQYLEIVSATLLGLYFFGDFPDLIAWTGVAVIIGSGIFVAWRERLNAKD